MQHHRFIFDELLWSMQTPCSANAILRSFLRTWHPLLVNLRTFYWPQVWSVVDELLKGSQHSFGSTSTDLQYATPRSLRDDFQLSARHRRWRVKLRRPSNCITPNSRLSEIAGAGQLRVNSFHSQAVDRVGDGLRVVGIAEDGVTEALERPDRTLVLATQWHPEVPPRKIQYFERLIEEAKRYRQRRAVELKREDRKRSEGEETSRLRQAQNFSVATAAGRPATFPSTELVSAGRKAACGGAARR